MTTEVESKHDSFDRNFIQLCWREMPWKRRIEKIYIQGSQEFQDYLKVSRPSETPMHGLLGPFLRSISTLDPIDI